MAEEKSLSKALQAIIENYLKEKPHQNASSIAKRAGLTPMTVSRLQKGEIQKPNFETVVALVGAVGGESFFSELRKFFPETFRTLEALKPEKIDRIDHEKMLDILEDSDTFKIFDLASMTGGTTRKEIEREFGIGGGQKLSTLIESGTLYEDSTGKISRKPGFDYYTIQPKDVLAQVKHRVADFRPQFLGTYKARLSYLSESLNEDGLLEIANLELDFLQKVIRIKSDSRYKGNIPSGICYFRNVSISEESLARRTTSHETEATI